MKPAPAPGQKRPAEKKRRPEAVCQADWAVAFGGRLLTALLLGALAGCSTMTSIQEIHAHPHRHWFTATVYLKGTVGDRVPLIGGLVYQLHDPTGTIWVLTHRTQQASGEPIAIKGIVRFQSIPIAGQEQGEAYIEEEQVLHPHDRATHY